ncbi:MAG: hypothetical protein M1832_004678 [Thelocarpon impressellum]|nr:MAG: hypothetical protein M1832_004678 [Thelocarpon impressellum]
MPVPQDYYMSPYVAEFVNTTTNIAYLYLAFYGLRNATRNNQHGVISVSYAALALVGVGSVVFHSTLKYTTQTFDELVMIYATASVLYAIYGLDIQPHYRRALGLFLLALVQVISLTHLFLGESTMHQLTFGVMVLAVAGKCTHLMGQVDDAAAKSQMKRLALVGSATFLCGWFVWLADDYFCPTLLQLRAHAGMPLGFLFELHGWWHILTAHGVYSYMVFVEFLGARTRSPRATGGAAPPRVELVWDAWVIPHIITAARGEARKTR